LVLLHWQGTTTHRTDNIRGYCISALLASIPLAPLNLEFKPRRIGLTIENDPGTQDYFFKSYDIQRSLQIGKFVAFGKGKFFKLNGWLLMRERTSGFNKLHKFKKRDTRQKKPAALYNSNHPISKF